MRIRPVGALAAITWIVAMMVSRAGAWVDLELVTDPQAVPVGGTVDVELWALWDGQGNADIGTIDAVLVWDGDVLELQESPPLPPSPPPVFLHGFLDDSDGDGLNNSLLDGNALYEVSWFSPITVPAEGMVVTTFEFLVVGPGTTDVSLLRSAECAPRSLRCLSGENFWLPCVDESDCPGERRCADGLDVGLLCTADDDCREGMCPRLCSGCWAKSCCNTQPQCVWCSFRGTVVRIRSGDELEDKTGVLRNTTVTAAVDVSLSAADVTMPAGSTAPVVVSGAIFGQDAGSVTITVELVPRAGAVGIVTFTPADPMADPPVPADIVQLGDPWPVGGFEPLDTDFTFEPMLNGSLHDNGMIGTLEPVFFVGPLTGFPIVASEDARGVWDVVLGGFFVSSWDAPGLETDLDPGVVVVVAPHDSDGSETVDLRDAAAFARCYTGLAGPPTYPTDPGLRCRVFDSDGDGDVDGDDLLVFNGLMWGP